jgi:hypothetical protein
MGSLRSLALMISYYCQPFIGFIIATRTFKGWNTNVLQTILSSLGGPNWCAKHGLCNILRNQFHLDGSEISTDACDRQNLFAIASCSLSLDASPSFALCLECPLPTPSPIHSSLFSTQYKFTSHQTSACRTKIEISLSRHNFHLVQKLLNSYSLGRFPPGIWQAPSSEPLFCWVATTRDYSKPRRVTCCSVVW